MYQPESCRAGKAGSSKTHKCAMPAPGAAGEPELEPWFPAQRPSLNLHPQWALRRLINGCVDIIFVFRRFIKIHLSYHKVPLFKACHWMSSNVCPRSRHHDRGLVVTSRGSPEPRCHPSLPPPHHKFVRIFQVLMSVESHGERFCPASFTQRDRSELRPRYGAAAARAFFVPSSVPSCGRATIGMSTHLLTDIQVVSRLLTLQRKLPRTFVSKYGHVLPFRLGELPWSGMTALRGGACLTS